MHAHTTVQLERASDEAGLPVPKTQHALPDGLCNAQMRSIMLCACAAPVSAAARQRVLHVEDITHQLPRPLSAHRTKILTTSSDRLATVLCVVWAAAAGRGPPFVDFIRVMSRNARDPFHVSI